MKGCNMKISDVLWIAANEHLSEVDFSYLRSNSFGWNRNYSCSAVYQVGEEFSSKTTAFLHELGVNINGFYEFDEFVPGEERQGARYLWLMFAYEVALSEGV